MPVFDDLKKMFLGAQDPGAAARVVQGMAGFATYVVDPAYQRLLASALWPWVERMSTRIPMAWYHPEVARHCDMPRASGHCQAKAFSMCTICRRDVCLSHAFIDAEARAICYGCADVARQHVQPVMNSAPGPEERQHQHAGASPDTREKDLAKAWRLLGLEPNADEEEIKQAYKDALKRYHPDRAKSAERKAANEAKFKQIRWAYDLINSNRKAA